MRDCSFPKDDIDMSVDLAWWRWATISNTARDFKISKITVFRKDGNAQLLEETLIGAGLKRIR